MKENHIKEALEGITFELNTLYNKGYEEGYKQANKDKEVDLYQRENVNFSLSLPDTDERREEYKKQRLERGFDDTELWNLDSTIIKFILPRLKAFRENHAGYPGCLKSDEEWNDILDSMIKYFTACEKDDSEDMEFYKDGWDNFCKYFFCLWD